MTLVIGAIAKDGIVFGSDSQVQFWSGVDVKRLGEIKIFKIEIPKKQIKFLVSGAGSISDIQWGLTSLYQHFLVNFEEINPNDITPDFVREIAERAIFILHQKYNIQRYREMGINIGDPEEPKFFSSLFLVGTILPSKEQLLLRILPNGRSELSENYITIGSGSAYAELLMKLVGYSKEEEWKKVALKIYKVIEAAESVDPNVGGPIHIAVLKENNEIKILSEDEIEEIWERVYKDEKRD